MTEFPSYQNLPEALDAFVIFGAGHLGKKVAALLESLGTPALAFSDNNSALWGQSIAGLEVFSPDEALRRFPHANFMVCIWHPAKSGGLRHRILQLHQLGCEHIHTFAQLFLRFPNVFLPNMFWATREQLDNEREAISGARSLFDERGKAEFDRQLRFRLGDPLALNDPEESAQYFPLDFLKLSEDEVFVDCGAYDGDTLEDFLSHTNGRMSRYLALEPDPGSREKLERKVVSLGVRDRVRVYPYAVGERRQSLHFQSDGMGSAISPNGQLTVDCISVDELLDGNDASFIKMDIEGFELDAIAGCRNTLARCHPKVAVCVYHRPDHLWRVPLTLKEYLPNARFTLRMYRTDGYDTVCYAVP